MALPAKNPASAPAAPFLKWAGGKTQLLPQILPRLPARMNTYYEPFIGGGAVFFALAREGRFRHAVLSDRNAELIEAYTMVRDYVGGLIDELSEHQRYATDPDYYYEVRALATAALSPLERAARLLFLNKTCFNGLYRVNKSGKFNVPFGKYAKPRVVNAPALLAASSALQGVDLLVADYASVASHARLGDAVYFDPPYVPLSSSSSFTAYHSSPFGPAQHDKLARVARDCMERGVRTVLSNSDCPETRALYAGMEFQSVQASRAINSKGSRRGRISELLVTGLTPGLPRVQGPRDSSLPAPAMVLSFAAASRSHRLPPMSEELAERQFERVADQTLVALCDAIDELDDDRLDAELASGVLSVEVRGASKIVINSHRAARQIWMAAGATAWHFDWDGARWIAQKDGAELWSTAEEKIGQALGARLQLEQGA